MMLRAMYRLICLTFTICGYTASGLAKRRDLIQRTGSCCGNEISAPPDQSIAFPPAKDHPASDLAGFSSRSGVDGRFAPVPDDHQLRATKSTASAVQCVLPAGLYAVQTAR